MEFLANLLSSPTLQQLKLADFLVFFMLLIVLPFLGVALISNLLALLLQPVSIENSRRLKNLVAGRLTTWIIAAFVPLATLAFLMRSKLHGAVIPIDVYMFRILTLVLAAALLLVVYRKWNLAAAGIAGLFLLLFAYINLINTLSLVIYPERWPFISQPLPHPFSIVPIIQSLSYLFASAALTGSTIIFIYFSWEERKLDLEIETENRLKLWGKRMQLGAVLSLPGILLWELYNLPDFALSRGIFWLAALILIALFFMALLVLNMLKKQHVRFATPMLVLALILFSLLILKDQALRNNATREDSLRIRKVAEQSFTTREAERQALYTSALAADAKAGEEIYNQRCTSCHHFDRKVLGPAYKDVLAKYVDRAVDLKAYLRNPSKVDPAFPAMPNPGLLEWQIEAVSKFLLEEWAKRSDGDMP